MAEADRGAAIEQIRLMGERYEDAPVRYEDAGLRLRIPQTGLFGNTAAVLQYYFGVKTDRNHGS